MDELHKENAWKIQYLIKSIHMKTRNILIKEFANKELTAHQMYILKMIKYHPEINLTTLGNYLNLAKSSISLEINKLVVMGYVKRVEDSTDRRIKTIELTSLGEEAVKLFKEDSKMIFNQLVSFLSNEELAEIEKCLNRLNEAIDESIEIKFK